MRKNYEERPTKKILFDGTVSIPATGNTNSTSIDTDYFSEGVLYVDAPAQYDVRIEVSDDNVAFFTLDERLDQTTGKKAYPVDLRGVNFMRINYTNDHATVAVTPTAFVSIVR